MKRWLNLFFDLGIELVSEELVDVILLMEGAGLLIRFMYFFCIVVV